ncbi:MAG TPA: DinB family protein, partial [Thermoanaerobaculia bacterium]
MNELIAKLETFQSRLLLAIHGIPDADLRRVEGEGKWSIFDVVAHLDDLELVTSVRIRTALATPGAPLPALEQNEWVSRVHRESLAEVLEAFWFHRRHNLQLLRTLTEEEWSIAGIHPEYGPRTIRALMERIESHQEKHLRQIERIKTALGLQASAEPDLSGVTFGRRNGKSYSPGEGIRVHELWSD